MPKIIYARAVTRVADMGGWTDTEYIRKKGGQGFVTSLAIGLHTYVSLIPADGKSPKVRIISENLEREARISNYRKIEYKGSLQLLQAAVKVMGVKNGFTARIRAEAPPGCGIGTSASVAVALLGALHKFAGKKIDPMAIAALAQRLETKELGLSCGVQDQYAAVLGGFNFMEIDYPQVKIRRIKFPEWLVPALENRMILVYFGPRSSSAQHHKVFPRFLKGDPQTVKAIELLKQNGKDMAEAIGKGDIAQIAKIINRNWWAQKMLSDEPGGAGITTKHIEWINDLAFKNGALAFDCNGAAGGGSAIILAKQGQEYRLRKALKAANVEILPLHFSFDGLQVWEE